MINEIFFINKTGVYNDRQLVVFNLIDKFGHHKTKYRFCKNELDIEYHKEEFIQAGYIILNTEISN